MTDSAPAGAAPTAEEPGVVPYLGARIRLISNANIAYEGSLYTLNSKEATIALQNVRCFGTEDRVADPAEFIAPSDDVYEFIVFRGQDIKDLRVLTQQPAAPRKPPQDPAILSTKAPPSAPGPAPAAPQARSNDQSGDQYAGPGSGDFLSRPQRRDNRPNDRPPRRDHGPHGHGHGHGWREPNQAEVVRDFDFEQANARFNKEEFLAGIQGQGHSIPSENKEAKSEEGDAPTPSEDDNEARARAALAAVQIQPLYDKKKSFFDNLSAGDGSSRPDRRSDTETFGAAGAHYRSRHSHRGGHGQGPNNQGGFQRGGRGGNRQSGPREWRDYEYRDRDAEPQREYGDRSDRGGRGGRGGRGRGGSTRGSWRSDQ